MKTLPNNHVRLYPYKQGSESASSLAKGLNVLRLKPEGSIFKGQQRHIIINWGSGDLKFHVGAAKVLNPPNVCSIWTNKLQAFVEMEKLKVSVPPFGTERQWAVDRISEKHTVFARRTLRGHSGAGIVEMHAGNMNEWVEAPLYTVYIPKEAEYRVHFVGKRIIDVQKKALKRDLLADGVEPNFKVRNLANGFVYARNDIEVPKVVIDQADLLIAGITLDFGAIDIIYNRKKDQAYVLEVNTAPGLKGTTLDNYVAAFKGTLGLP